MSLTVSCTINVSAEEVSVNGLEKAALVGAREAGQKLFRALLGLTERTLATGRSCECGGRPHQTAHYRTLMRKPIIGCDTVS